MLLKKLLRVLGWITVLVLFVHMIGIMPQWIAAAAAIWILLVILGGKRNAA